MNCSLQSNQQCWGESHVFNHLQLTQLILQQQKEAENFKYTLHCVSSVKVYMILPQYLQFTVRIFQYSREQIHWISYFIPRQIQLSQVWGVKFQSWSQSSTTFICETTITQPVVHNDTLFTSSLSHIISYLFSIESIINFNFFWWISGLLQGLILKNIYIYIFTSNMKAAAICTTCK